MSSNSLLKSQFSSSMQDIAEMQENEEITWKDKLKRTFSSIKRRSKGRKTLDQKLSVSIVKDHKPLRAVRSVPNYPNTR